MSKSHTNNLNDNLSYIMRFLKNKNIDGYFTTISNEHLNEYINDNENTIKYLTGFTGDTASLYVNKNKAFLFIDGRFTVQAKKEIKNNKIKIVLLDVQYNIYDALTDIIKNDDKIYIDYHIHSILKINKIKNEIDKKINLVQIPQNFPNFNIEEEVKDELILLDKKYTDNSSIDKIKILLNELSLMSENNNIYYISSNLEEIAYITNIRNKNIHSALFKSFLLINKNKNILYLDLKISDKIKKYLTKNKIVIKAYNEFYEDIKNIADKNNIKNKTEIFIDYKINNYYIYLSILKNKNIIINDASFISPLYKMMSIRSDKEIKNLKFANIYDGIAICNSLYKIKNINFDKHKYTEYDIKQIVDTEKTKSKYFLQNSFDTIVAYKQNSAICHYIPSQNNSKIIKKDSVLLIDTGANYLQGTTDITRTISLYKNKIPADVKKNFTLVLKSHINLAKQKFLYGYTGRELDLLARTHLYNEYLDFEHGTGHGIGNITNVHHGPNNFSPGVDTSKTNNVLQINQVQSLEPGLYFENKYGIRIENDTYVKYYKKNKFGEYLGFETLTLCPIDLSLVEQKILTKSEIEWLNNYHKLVYDKLNKYFESDMLKWFKNATRKI